MEDDRWDRRCSETEMRALRERGLTSGAHCAAGARARAGERERLQAERGDRAGPGGLLGWSRGAGVWARRENGAGPGVRDGHGKERGSGWVGFSFFLFLSSFYF